VVEFDYGSYKKTKSKQHIGKYQIKK